MSDSVVEVRDLTKRYGAATAVNGISFSVQRGEIFGLLGPNGAGKTTTILMMLGLTDVTSGTVRVMGHDPVREPLQVKRVVGYMPDTVGFYDYMTATDNLRYTAALIGIPSAFLLHGYVGFLFGSVKANPWWSSVLIPIVFLFSDDQTARAIGHENPEVITPHLDQLAREGRRAYEDRCEPHLRRSLCAKEKHLHRISRKSRYKVASRFSPVTHWASTSLTACAATCRRAGS